MSDERAERVATGATVEQWWGWNIERQKWFPCLQREERECVVDGGVIVFASIEGRDRRRDEIVGMARAVLAALDEEPDHFYLATFRDYDDSQTTDTEPYYRRSYTIVDGPHASPLDARDSGWLSDEEWDRAVVLGFRGTRALAAYHDMESDEPTEDALDAESAQDALYERVSHPALDEEPTLEDVLNAARWITHIGVMANENEHYDALITGYVSEDGFRSGEGTGATIAEAIRQAVQRAKEQG